MPLNYPVIYKTQDIKGDAIVAQAVQTAILDAEALWQPEKFDGVFPVKGFGIKRLQPRDMVAASGSIVGPSNSTWTYSANTASTWQTWISAGTISQMAYVVITGIYNYDTNHSLEAIKFTADGVEYPVNNIEEMFGWYIGSVHFSHPIVVRPEKSVTISVRTRNTGQHDIGLLGYTIAKRSYLIATL